MAITINGTNGLTTDNGALKLDTDTLVVDDTNNRVGIGTDSPTAQLHIKGTDTTDQVIIENTDAGSTSAPDLILYRNSASPAVNDYITKFAFRGNNNLGTEIDYASIFAQSDNVTSGSETGSISFRSYNSEIMRINSTGVGIGTTTPTAKLNVRAASSQSAGLVQVGTDGYPGFDFRNAAGAQQGYIQINASSVAYVNVSDYRLKENVVEITDGIDRVKLLNPSRFNFIADSDTTVDGFLAHEAQAVVPEAVTGTHNEVDADGNPVMQGIDQSKLVPLLTAALQEAITKIEALEARVTALENA